MRNETCKFMRQIKTQRYVLKYNIIYFVSFTVPDLQNHSYIIKVCFETSLYVSYDDVHQNYKLANMHYGRIRHGDKCATPFKSIMSFYVICVVCIFA